MTMHTVFSAECNPTFDWHSVALFHSHRVRAQPGGITRLLACSDEDLKTYQGLDIGPTFVHPNHRGMGGMNYAAFNKPASVNYWIRSGAVPDGVEYVMQLDADMLVNRPVIPEELGVKPGVVLSAPYDYLVGTHSGLADVFGVKNKSYQARVGGVHVFHISDLRRIAPLWLEFTERIRTFSCEEPERYFKLAAPQEGGNAKEVAATRRQFMWMVEMYGYVFGAAEAGVQVHTISRNLMAYVGSVYRPPGPYILHYGIDWKIPFVDNGGNRKDYVFNKLTYQALDVSSCPRWFFPLPPYSREDTTVSNASFPVLHAQGTKYHVHALAGKQIEEFNDALCLYYQRHCRIPVSCPPPDQERAPEGSCADYSSNCLNWARVGECTANPQFMLDECRQSCGKCDFDAPAQSLDARSGRVQPMLGDPAGTCFDVEPRAICEAYVRQQSCSTQRSHLQEICRESCHFCNSSGSAFTDSQDLRKKEDTADHSCPDGSDLGRGAKSVDVFNGKPAAASPTGQVAGTMPRPTETARRDAKLDGRAILANAASLPDHMLSERIPRPRARDREKELEFLDSISASWPFFLVQSLFLICCGFMLRGYTDRRRRRRMFPNSSLAEPPRGAERHNRHTSLQTGQRHGDEVPL
ncbi:hypothetical protein AB1Y20_009114 [Prymnesium parvum]|uniref:ShKT domain-containing protein n=1 Tax=Prymnesium parvum TaxID=97485 RepID=A0AB34JZG1_PRYPA